MNSLERSLQIGLVVSLVVLLFVFWWTVTLSSRLLTESVVFMRLEDEAKSIVSILELDPASGSLPRLSQHKLDPAYDEPASGHYFVVDFPQEHRLMSRSSWEQSFALQNFQAGQSQRLRLRGLAGTPVLMWVGGYSVKGQEFSISVARDIHPIVQTLRVFQWFSAAVAVLLLLALLGVLHQIMKRSVAKLDVIRRDMQRLEQGKVVSLSEEVPTEIMPLVREFNQLLRRFEQRLRQSRNAVGNLAHSLKGPLNLLMRAAHSDVMDDQERTAISQNAEHIRRLIENELKRARLAGHGSAGKRFNIVSELPAMIGLLEQVYSEKNLAIRHSVKRGVELMQDRQDMLELIGNLLDNAAKWCRSIVTISIEQGDGVMITVEDDGPGCSPEVLNQLTDRGVRLDESVAGHGLGLSIVKDIVDSYDGQIRLQPSMSLGGLKASIYLPDHK